MTWLRNNWPQVFELAWAHLVLAVPAIVLSVLVAVPLGWLAQRRPALGGVLLTGASLAYAVPALPLLIIIPALAGTPLRSAATMVLALTVYGVALGVRTAADAFGQVDADVLRAATAVGYGPVRRFWAVELPLAVGVLIAGTRVMSVSTVSLVTIGALVGVPSLGTLLTDGFQRGIMAEVVTGVLATVALALALDALLLVLGRVLTPWTKPVRAERADPVVAV